MIEGPALLLIQEPALRLGAELLQLHRHIRRHIDDRVLSHRLPRKATCSTGSMDEPVTSFGADKALFGDHCIVTTKPRFFSAAWLTNFFSSVKYSSR
jgi:hypothetical protein